MSMGATMVSPVSLLRARVSTVTLPPRSGAGAEAPSRRLGDRAHCFMCSTFPDPTIWVTWLA